MPLDKQNFVVGSRRGVDDGRQTRSRQAYDRIVAAARELCDGRQFSAVSVQEICQKAEVSTSSFYARFADKDALLHVLHEDYLESMFEATADGFYEVDWAALTLQAVVIRFGELFLSAGRANRDFMVSMHRSEFDNPVLGDRRVAFERAALDLFVRALERRLGPFDTSTALRVRVAWETLCAVLRETLSHMETPSIVGVPEDRFLEHLAEQFCAYTDLDTAPVDR